MEKQQSEKREPISRAAATRRLANRWHEQAEQFPTMRRDTPLKLYVAANLGIVMRRGLLAEYDRA